ncbi:unnamed protein product [Adineta ricciae]|uniref:Uncharacterized protein n=1 Tax=Adineta ricciae TaxID=249248 RepID=A0A815LH21_ADIRI|nr:unnamed protein product [Adineta ricciae]
MLIDSKSLLFVLAIEQQLNRHTVSTKRTVIDVTFKTISKKKKESNYISYLFWPKNDQKRHFLLRLLLLIMLTSDINNNFNIDIVLYSKYLY